MNLQHSLRGLVAKLGLWFDPLDRLRRLLVLVLLIALPLALLAGGAAAVAAWSAMRSSYSATAVLRARAPAAPPNLIADLAAYRVPEVSDKEILGWFQLMQPYRDLYPLSGRSDGVGTLRALISVVHEREPRRFAITYRGAGDAEAAVSTMRAFGRIMLALAQGEARRTIERDLAFYRGESQRAALELDRRTAASSRVMAESGIVSADEEVHARMDAAGRLAERAEAAEAELAQLRRRIAGIPLLAAGLPAEVPGNRATVTAGQLRATAAREQVRRLEAVYAEGNPLVVEAQEQLAGAEIEAHAANAGPDTMVRNPVLAALDEDLARARLDEPRIVAEAERLRGAAQAARTRLAELPERLAGLRQAIDERTQAATLLHRLRGRLAEVEMALSMAPAQLEIAEEAASDLVGEKPRRTKALIAGVAAAAACLLLAGSILAWRLVRDRRIRGPADARCAFACDRCVVVPAGPPGAAEDAGNLPWLAALADGMSCQAASFLVVGQHEGLRTARWAHLLAHRLAEAGLRTLVVADGPSAGLPDPGRGLDAVLDGHLHPRDALVPLTGRLGWLPLGDPARVAAAAPSARIELLLSELMEHAEAVVVAAADRDDALLRRLAMPVEAVVAVVDPRSADGSRFVRQLRALGRPVVAVVIET